MQFFLLQNMANIETEKTLHNMLLLQRQEEIEEAYKKARNSSSFSCGLPFFRPERVGFYSTPEYFRSFDFLRGAFSLIPNLVQAIQSGEIPNNISFKEQVKTALKTAEEELLEKRMEPLKPLIQIPEHADSVFEMTQGVLSYLDGYRWAASVLGVNLIGEDNE